MDVSLHVLVIGYMGANRMEGHFWERFVWLMAVTYTHWFWSLSHNWMNEVNEVMLV
jgi:hypothetical protein